MVAGSAWTSPSVAIAHPQNRELLVRAHAHRERARATVAASQAIRQAIAWQREVRRYHSLVMPSGPGVPEARGFSLSLPSEARQVPFVRRLVGDICCIFDLEELAELAQLLVSETLTNAVVHARSPFVMVAAKAGPEELRVHVSDDDFEPPVLRHPAPDAVGGRGLLLVSSLADDWGVTRQPLGKTVWFLLKARGAGST